MHKPAPILLVEDTLTLQFVYSSTLEAAGYEVVAADTASASLALFREHQPDVVLVDLVLPDRDGQYLMREMLAERPSTRVVLVTAQASMSKVIEAMRAGGQDFLIKPFDESRLITAVRNSVAAVPAAKAALSQSASAAPGIPGLPGSSAVMRRIAAQIRALSYTMAPIFLTGQKGTGKAMCARALHDQSPRAGRPFVTLDCASIPREQLDHALFGYVAGAFIGAQTDFEGVIKEAAGGTLYLSSVESIGLALQPKLLQFLQTGIMTPAGARRQTQVDLRLICATETYTQANLAYSGLAPDLLQRLNVAPIHMPNLSERGTDVIDMAETALRRYSMEYGKSFRYLSADLRAKMLTTIWPDNSVGLHHAIARAVKSFDGVELTPTMIELPDPPEITPVQEPPPPVPPLPTLESLMAGQSLAQLERIAIESAVARHNGSLPNAAKELGVAPSTLYRKRLGWLPATTTPSEQASPFSATDPSSDPYGYRE